MHHKFRRYKKVMSNRKTKKKKMACNKVVFHLLIVCSWSIFGGTSDLLACLPIRNKCFLRIWQKYGSTSNYLMVRLGNDQQLVSKGSKTNLSTDKIYIVVKVQFQILPFGQKQKIDLCVLLGKITELRILHRNVDRSFLYLNSYIFVPWTNKVVFLWYFKDDRN